MRPLTTLVSVVRSSLKLKLILFVVLILGLTVGIAPWSAIRAQKRQLLEDAQEHLESLQQTLKALVESSMLMNDRQQVQRVVELLTGHQENQAGQDLQYGRYDQFFFPAGGAWDAAQP